MVFGAASRTTGVRVDSSYIYIKCIHTCIHSYIHTYIYIYTYIHIFIHNMDAI